jgi:Tfp pilus assembly protein PilO
MTSQLSLTNPNLLKTLRIVRITLLVIVLLGSVAGGYSLWSVRQAVNAENERMAAFRKQIAEMRDVLNSKRKDAALADNLQTQPPDGAGSAFFIQAVNHLAEQMHLSHFTIRMTESAPRPQQAPPANGGNAPKDGNANAAPPANGEPSEGPLANWEKSGFDVEVSGEFRDLSDFLKRLSAIPHVVEVASIDVHPLGKGSKDRSGKLLMHLSGTLYGLPQNTEQTP